VAIKTIFMIGDDVLRRTSEDLDFKKDDIDQILQDLKDTLHHAQDEKQIGRAIAAPQIGCLKRVVYMETTDQVIVMINPEVTYKSPETFVVWDSCFSADVAFFGKTVRHKTITVEYVDEYQNTMCNTFTDDLSELFQHEIDHLDGVLFTDHIVDHHIIMRSEWEKLR